MKNIIFALFFLLLISFAYSNKTNEASFEKKEKIYVDVSNIFFENNEIYVQKDNEWFQTRGVFSDSKGVYVEELWPFIGFYCKKCGTYNHSYRTNCKKCGLRRPD